jgi:hypothetical protein
MAKLKTPAMQTFKIKTHKQNEIISSAHFFLLSKGYNAGKPIGAECPNCFSITFTNESDKNIIFWICYALWKSGRYLPLLVGSVIPFLHIRDIRIEIEQALRQTTLRTDDFDRSVRQLQSLIKTEKHLTLQLKLISELKATIALEIVSDQLKNHSH